MTEYRFRPRTKIPADIIICTAAIISITALLYLGLVHGEPFSGV